MITGGSPPRVRGKHPFRRGRAPLRRITPACAGKTRLTSHAYHPPADHPRVCGENEYYKEIGFIADGSPPRVRGKLAGIM